MLDDDVIAIQPEQVRDLHVIGAGADRFAVENYSFGLAPAHEHADAVEAAE
jgi:hypothetical protein